MVRVVDDEVQSDWCFFFFNEPATPETYPLPHHGALPIPQFPAAERGPDAADPRHAPEHRRDRRRGAARTGRDELGVVQGEDRKSTRLNSSHANISYAVFCLKKKKHLTDV